MSLDLVEIVTSLDRDEDVHLARILVLLKAFARTNLPAIEGITKLAKLDFLLRYPSCLEKALLARGLSAKNIPVDDFDRLTIEARMIRYRYGPWDHRYRRFLNTVAEEDQALVNRLTEAIDAKREATLDITERMKEQESLIAEFITMKFKIVRSSTASELLKGAEFDACPVCGTKVNSKGDGVHCVLCKSDLDKAPGGFEGDSAVMERDLSDRIHDLKRSIQRLRRSHERQQGELDALLGERRESQRRVGFARKQIESEYIKRARKLESRRGAIKERRSLLMRIKGMPGEVEAKLKEADGLTAKIAELEREIQTEQGRFEDGRKNVRALERNFHKVLQAIRFPEIKEDDKVFVNQRTWFPYVHPKGNEFLAWTFNDARSGGKMVLFKICFALALHVTSARQNLPIPHLLIIDLPMKNVTPDINPEIFEHFYRELYRLLDSNLSDWQCVIIDQTLFEPPPNFQDHIERLLTKDDPEHPPLISYYKGH